MVGTNRSIRRPAAGLGRLASRDDEILHRYSLECRLRRADGVYRWWLIRGAPLRDANGAILKWFGTCTDIHDLKEAEAQLRESEERFRGAFENSAIGMALLSLEGRFMRVNGALCGIVGRTAEELLDCTFQDITYPADFDADLAKVRALMAGEIDHYQMEKRYLHKAGHISGSFSPYAGAGYRGAARAFRSTDQEHHRTAPSRAAHPGFA